MARRWVWEPEPVTAVKEHRLKAGETWRIEHEFYESTEVKVRLRATNPVVLTVLQVIYAPYSGEIDSRSPDVKPLPGTNIDHRFKIYLGGTYAFIVKLPDGSKSASFSLEIFKTVPVAGGKKEGREGPKS